MVRTSADGEARGSAVECLEWVAVAVGERSAGASAVSLETKQEDGHEVQSNLFETSSRTFATKPDTRRSGIERKMKQL